MLTVSESRTDIVLTALRLPHVRLGVGLTLFAMLLQAASGSFAFTTPLVFFGGWYLGSGLLLMKQQQAAKELAERARARSDAEGSERPEEGLPHVNLCPVCADPMETGNLEVGDSKYGLDLFGWALTHCWYVPEDGPKELFVSNQPGLQATHPDHAHFREARLCRTCNTSVVPGEQRPGVAPVA